MNNIFEEMVLRYTLEQICEEHDLEPAFVVKLLYEEGYLELEETTQEEYEDDT